MKMEPIVSSETSAIKSQTPGNYPKRNKLIRRYFRCRPTGPVIEDPEDGTSRLSRMNGEQFHLRCGGEDLNIRRLLVTWFTHRLTFFFSFFLSFSFWSSATTRPCGLPGHGRSVTDFWGWDAHEARLRCPDNVSGDIGGCSARRALKPKFYQPTQTMVTAGILPFKENSHGRTGNRTRDLMISSQILWPLDHETGHTQICRLILYFSHNKQLIFPLYNINWLVSVTEMKSIYCAVRPNSLNKTVFVSYLKGYSQRVSYPNHCARDVWIKPDLFVCFAQNHATNMLDGGSLSPRIIISLLHTTRGTFRP